MDRQNGKFQYLQSQLEDVVLNCVRKMLPKVVQSLLISAEVTRPLNEVIHGWCYSHRANSLVGPSKFESSTIHKGDKTVGI